MKAFENGVENKGSRSAREYGFVLYRMSAFSKELTCDIRAIQCVDAIYGALLN